MIGISKELETDLAARGYSGEDVARLFNSRCYEGEIRVIYQRPNGDRTSALPSSRHMQYYGVKGWTAVAIADEEPAVPAAPPLCLPRRGIRTAGSRRDLVAR
jgi:hypothetical protein